MKDTSARLWFAACVLLLATRAPTQDEQSALAALVERADAVAIAQAVRVDSADAAHLRVSFRVEERLRGELPPTFELAESRGRGCGRALTAIAVGQRFIACVRARDGRFTLCAGSARALPLAAQPVLAHVRALLEAAPGRGQLAVLLAGLTAADERVRTDAALSLPFAAALEQVDASERTAIVAALQQALATRERTVPSLFVAAVRLHAVEALDVVLPRYLGGEAPPLERLFAAGMVQLDANGLATRIAAQLPTLTDALSRARATSLLLDIDTQAAVAPLLALAKDAGERGTRLRACSGLLRLGTDERDLAVFTDPELLALAKQAAQPKRPRFRSIRTEER